MAEKTASPAAKTRENHGQHTVKQRQAGKPKIRRSIVSPKEEEEEEEEEEKEGETK